ncbi:ArsR/SmtB family transcription factor [Cucumibacter marinus]|uniref:ArsR/SmtB family transcription factor n=1 Tax=Cucumibacter marinus TaxID=1121252 RepID=UPI000409CFD7|nr:metalloregulator ArsR/SmtB family transcription factor [Cucumibacter marinus]
MTTTTTNRDDQLDLIFHALANRTRRALLALLAKGPSRVTDLAEPFGVSLNAISKHLAVLEKAGLVSRRIDGRVHHCALVADPMASAGEWIAAYERFWSARLDSFVDYVENEMD